MKTYWISFVDTVKDVNVGCCIIDAKDEKEAIKKTLKLKINPGGQALLFKMPRNEKANNEINRWGKNKLILPKDLMNNNYRKIKDLDKETQEKIKDSEGFSMICKKHNK